MARKQVIWKRGLSLMMASAFALNSVPVTALADDSAKAVLPEAELLADFTFDDAATGFSGGQAKASGTYTLADVDGKKAIYLDGSATNYLNVTNSDGSSLLTGKEELTISFEAKPDRTATNWGFYAAPDTNKQTYNKEVYVGAMINNGTTKIERYKNNGSRATSVSAATGTGWTRVDVVLDEDSTTIYVNGEKEATVASSYKLSDILGESSILQIGKANWGNGEYYKGWMDNFKIYDGALTDEEIAEEIEKAYDDEKVVELAKEQLAIANAEDVRGNITLPAEITVEGSGKKAAITWKSDRPDVITDQETDGKAAGVVSRQDADTTVKMTATLICGASSDTKEFTLHVKKRYEMEKTTDYLFAHFTGTEGRVTDEQIYFATSEDGSQWTDLRANGNPVLSSEIGDKGVRDPYLIRSPEGDKIFLIATDLSIYYRGGWGNAAATSTGSTKLVVWESTDLVNWTEPRLVDVAGKIPGAGCAWAPEAFYDEATGNYVVYWATASDESNAVGDRMNMYYCTTRDFYTFTDPVLWIDRDHSIIDTTMIYDENTKKYYRASGDGQITIEQSDSIYEGWEIIGTLSGIFNNNNYSGSKLEGPEFFKYNEDDYLTDTAGNPVETWGLMCDQYAEGKGYLPFRSTNLADMTTESWSRASDVNFASLKKRHGTILPVTRAEYKAVRKAFAGIVDEDDPMETKVLADFTFDDDSTGFVSEYAKASGNYTLKDSYDGKALYLDGSASNYLTVTDKSGNSLLTGAKELTISYEMKPDRTDTNWAFYAAPNTTAQTYNKETYLGIMVNGGTTTVERYKNNGSRPAKPSAVTGSDWVHVDVVIAENETTIYVNGEKQSSQASSYALSDILGANSILQIGKANWGTSGEYFKGWMDNFRIVNKALTAEEVKELSAEFLTKMPLVKAAMVGTAPDRTTALEYRGTDDHTAIRTEVDSEKKEIVSYVRKGTDLTKVPVTFELNNPQAEIKADGTAFINGGELNLTEDVQVVFQAGDKTETWMVRKPVVSNNPVLPGQYADPDIDYLDGKFWIFPTTDGYPSWSGTVFHAFSSKDLVNWEDEGIILDVANDDPGKNEKGVQISPSLWSEGSAWAPTIEEKDGKYYFYYCAKHNGTSSIGVAVADDPAGPYTDKGSALVTKAMCDSVGVSMGQAIDPSIFTDDDGTSYITFGNGSAAIAELNDDMMSIKEGTLKQIRGLTSFRESVVVTKAEGKYHWTWSCDDANSPNYHVNYGVSDTLNGTITVRGTLLQKDESKGILGSAHQSVVHIQDKTGKDRYFMAYHRFYTPLDIFISADGLGKHRETCIDEIFFDKDGYMTITPTLEGVEAVDLTPDIPVSFVDVKEDDWFAPCVQYVYEQKIMKGMDATHFGPDGVLTRAQFAAMLYRMEGSPEVTYRNVFTDVKDGEFYTDAVMWASSENVGVITGYAGGELFGPSDMVTREQMALMMYRYARYKGYDTTKASDLTGFPDKSEVSEFAEKAVSWAAAEGLLKGDQGKLHPLGAANRAEGAAVIQRFMENIIK